MAAAPIIFTAHAVTDGSSDLLRLVPHRFSWTAFWFGAVWALMHRLWVVAVFMLIFDSALLGALRVGSLSLGAAVTLWILASLLMGLEGNEWRRRSLVRRGVALSGFGFGSDESEALARMSFRNGVEGASR